MDRQTVSKVLGIGLAAGLLLLGGGQAIAPAPAFAMVDNGPGDLVCSELGASWFDQWCFQQGDLRDDGGGDGGSSTARNVPPPGPSKPPPMEGHEVIRPTGTAPKRNCGDQGVICPPWGGNRTPQNNDAESKPDRNDRWNQGHASCGSRRSSSDREGVCQAVQTARPANRAEALWAKEKERIRECQLSESELKTLLRWTQEMRDTGMTDGEPPVFEGEARETVLRAFELAIGLVNEALRENSCHLYPTI
jgi:hypothetical protein